MPDVMAASAVQPPADPPRMPSRFPSGSPPSPPPAPLPGFWGARRAPPPARPAADAEPLPVGLARLGQREHGGHHVGHVHDAPLPAQPFPVGPAVPAGTGVGY